MKRFSKVDDVAHLAIQLLTDWLFGNILCPSMLTIFYVWMHYAVMVILCTIAAVYNNKCNFKSGITTNVTNLLHFR